MAFTEIPLSEAIFPIDQGEHTGGVPHVYGQYRDGRIVNKDGNWPDWYLPSLVLDRTVETVFQFVFDPDDPEDSGGRRVYIFAGLDTDVQGSYTGPSYDLFFNELFNYNDWFNDIPPSAGLYELTDPDTVTVTLPPSVWIDALIPEGYNTPLFETDNSGAIAQFWWSGGSGGGGPVVYPSTRLDSRSAFAS